jgi:MFS family permease
MEMPKEHGLSAGVAAVVLTVVIANLGNNIVSPLMPAIKEHFGSTAGQVSLMASGFGLGRLVMDLPAGVLIDRVGPTRLFTIGILLSGAAAALAALSASLEQLIAFRTAMGFGSAIMSTVALTLLARIAPPDQRGAVLGFYTSAMLFGQAISPTIGGYLGTIFDWRAAFVFCALTPFVSFPMNLLVTSKTDAVQASHSADEGRSEGASPARRAQVDPATPGVPNWPALATVYLGTFVNFFDRHGMRNSLLPLYAGMVLGLDPGFIGAVLTTGSVITILINIPSGTLSDRIGKKLLLIPGLLTLVIGNLCVLLGDTSTPVFVVATVLISMGVLSNSMLTALVADLVPERLAGQGMGMYRFTSDLGAVLGPMALGLIVDNSGFSVALVAGACVVLLGVTAVLVFIPRRIAPAPADQAA